MTKDQITRYIWLVDVLKRYGRLSRREISDLWQKSAIGDGSPMPERTFFHYRRNIEECFHIDIECDRDGRYGIETEQSESERTLSNWLLDSYAVNEALKMSDNAAEWVEVEDVPSARRWLPSVLESIRDSTKVTFSYLGFNRSRTEQGIVFHPYLLKRYKQRWYVAGQKEKSGEVRTYALDRIQSLESSTERFERPTDFDTSEIFGNIIGITASKADVRTVKLMTTPIQAKYFRALPLHSSQSEAVGDGYSIFTYRLKLNYELVHEIMGLGSDVKVLEPKELQVMVKMALKEALSLYEK